MFRGCEQQSATVGNRVRYRVCLFVRSFVCRGYSVCLFVEGMVFVCLSVCLLRLEGKLFES